MRSLALAVALLAAAPLSAQPFVSRAPEAPPRSAVVLDAADFPPETRLIVREAADAETPHLPQRGSPNAGTLAVMAAGGVLVAGAYASGGLVDGTPGLFWLTPLVGGATTYGLGEAMGHRGDPLRALGFTSLGAIPGSVLIVAGAAGLGSDGDSDDLISDDAVLIVLGLVAYTVIPPVAAAAGHIVRPTVQATPDGGMASGLSVRIGL